MSRSLDELDDVAPEADIGRDDIRETGDGSGLDAALRSAKRPADHPKYDAATATQNTDEEVTHPSGNVSERADSGVTSEVTSVTSTGSASALFELDAIAHDPLQTHISTFGRDGRGPYPGHPPSGE